MLNQQSLNKTIKKYVQLFISLIHNVQPLSASLDCHALLTIGESRKYHKIWQLSAFNKSMHSQTAIKRLQEQLITKSLVRSRSEGSISCEKKLHDFSTKITKLTSFKTFVSTSRQMQNIDAEKMLIKLFVYIENNQLLYRQLFNKFSLKRIQKKYLHSVTYCLHVDVHSVYGNEILKEYVDISLKTHLGSYIYVDPRYTEMTLKKPM